MTQRAYTVREVDDLKKAHATFFLYGLYYLPEDFTGPSRTYSGSALCVYAEEATRTSMIAGHTAEDLIASEQVKEMQE